MAKFRITYYTDGGPFSHEIEAENATEAEARAVADKEQAGGRLRIMVGDFAVLVEASHIAAISVEPAGGALNAEAGDRRSIGLRRAASTS